MMEGWCNARSASAHILAMLFIILRYRCSLFYLIQVVCSYCLLWRNGMVVFSRNHLSWLWPLHSAWTWRREVHCSNSWTNHIHCCGCFRYPKCCHPLIRLSKNGMFQVFIILPSTIAIVAQMESSHTIYKFYEQVGFLQLLFTLKQHSHFTVLISTMSRLCRAKSMHMTFANIYSDSLTVWNLIKHWFVLFLQ